ncbi:pickpocket protein 28-like [Homalodisca vitripennis]|uniref:pickpocket protein 28-like n=1 Tax=Homalodisca vitripennis TaxID=197043 RepID=UPI001EEA30A9|nr:pickpocket protein 28-like [Homalodisca vitripennis]
MLFFHTPVLMSMDSTATPIWDIPFPAVTICSENQVRPSSFNYSSYKTRTNLTEREQETLEYLTLTCEYNSTETKLDYFSSDVLDYIHNGIWERCNETIWNLSWMTEDVEDPCDIIQPVLTPAGACHTFNSLPGDRLYRDYIYSSLHDHAHQLKSSNDDIIWSPDRGFRNKEATNGPPWRTPGGGYGQDAIFLLNLNSQDFDEACFFGGHGFLVILHSPAELPTLSHPSTYVHADHLSQIKVIPEIKTTDEELRRWDPKLRGCFFEDERPLKYFQFYTEKNCDLECESNASLSLCGCVPFFHPRTRDTPVCGPEKFYCYVRGIGKSVDPETTESHHCNCLPSCFEIEYRISVANFRRNFSTASGKGFYKDRYPGIIPEDSFAIVTTQYQTQKVTALMRVAVFSLSDFIANIGGLLGLFLGFSFLSLFEIVYFCVLRFNKKKPKRVSPSENRKKLIS